MGRIETFIKNNFRDILFYVILVFNLSVLFGTKYIPTLDGGAHCYNAKIVGSLLTDSQSFYSSFFKMNPEAVPNWFTGGLLSVMNSFLSPETTEKITLFLFFLFFPILFKRVVDYYAQFKSYIVLLVFPFTHFALVYYGFFNFSYGIVFCLLGISYWSRNFDNLTVKRLLVFSLICLCAYFSHLFSLITLLLFCGLKEVYEAVDAVFVRESKTQIKKQLVISFLRSLKLFACALIPLILTYIYFSKRPSAGLEQYNDTTTLNNMLTEGNIFKSFSPTEDYTAKTFFYVFCALTLYSIISRIVEATLVRNRTVAFKRQDVFFYCSAVMLYLFYTQPDNDGYGAFISIRLALYSFIFMSLWLACNKYDGAVKITASLVLIINLHFFIGVKKDSIKWLNAELKKMDGVTARIKEGSIVVPLNFADYNWLGAHY